MGGHEGFYEYLHLSDLGFLGIIFSIWCIGVTIFYGSVRLSVARSQTRFRPY